MKTGLPVRRVLAVLVPLAIVAFLVVERAAFGEPSPPVPSQGPPTCRVDCRYVGVALARAARLLGVIWYDQDARMSWELNNRPAALAAFRRAAQRFRQAG